MQWLQEKKDTLQTKRESVTKDTLQEPLLLEEKTQAPYQERKGFFARISDWWIHFKTCHSILPTRMATSELKQREDRCWFCRMKEKSQARKKLKEELNSLQQQLNNKVEKGKLDNFFEKIKAKSRDQYKLSEDEQGSVKQFLKNLQDVLALKNHNKQKKIWKALNAMQIMELIGEENPIHDINELNSKISSIKEKIKIRQGIEENKENAKKEFEQFLKSNEESDAKKVTGIWESFTVTVCDVPEWQERTNYLKELAGQVELEKYKEMLEWMSSQRAVEYGEDGGVKRNWLKPCRALHKKVRAFLEKKDRTKEEWNGIYKEWILYDRTMRYLSGRGELNKNFCLLMEKMNQQINENGVSGDFEYAIRSIDMMEKLFQSCENQDEMESQRKIEDKYFEINEKILQKQSYFSSLRWKIEEIVEQEEKIKEEEKLKEKEKLKEEEKKKKEIVEQEEKIEKEDNKNEKILQEQADFSSLKRKVEEKIGSKTEENYRKLLNDGKWKEERNVFISPDQIYQESTDAVDQFLKFYKKWIVLKQYKEEFSKEYEDFDKLEELAKILAFSENIGVSLFEELKKKLEEIHEKYFIINSDWIVSYGSSCWVKEYVDFLWDDQDGQNIKEKTKKLLEEEKKYVRNFFREQRKNRLELYKKQAKNGKEKAEKEPKTNQNDLEEKIRDNLSKFWYGSKELANLHNLLYEEMERELDEILKKENEKRDERKEFSLETRCCQHSRDARYVDQKITFFKWLEQQIQKQWNAKRFKEIRTNIKEHLELLNDYQECLQKESKCCEQLEKTPLLASELKLTGSMKYGDKLNDYMYEDSPACKKKKERYFLKTEENDVKQLGADVKQLGADVKQLGADVKQWVADVKQLGEFIKEYKPLQDDLIENVKKNKEKIKVMKNWSSTQLPS